MEESASERSERKQKHCIPKRPALQLTAAVAEQTKAARCETLLMLYIIFLFCKIALATGRLHASCAAERMACMDVSCHISFVCETCQSRALFDVR
jgi:hypothetical protein